MIRRKHVHTLAITVVFDEPVAESWAIRELRDCFNGRAELTPGWKYGNIFPKSQASYGHIRSIKRIKDIK